LIATKPPLTEVLGIATRYVLGRPSSLLPALVLLLPTLALQLAVPTYLRTRLAPAMWTVVAGGAVLIWLSQIATPAVCALVHARRTGTRPLRPAELLRLSLAIGTSATLGLALAVLPGLWVQARYALAPLPAWRGPHGSSIATLRHSPAETRPVLVPLMIVALLVLAGSALGQGVVAALAEWVGTLTPVRQASGRTIFELHYVPHALTSIMTYAWSAAALTVYAAGVSVLCDSIRCASVSTSFERARPGKPLQIRSVPAGAVAAAILLALAAVVYKVQQHL
jgi:hypothetical protein